MKMNHSFCAVAVAAALLAPVFGYQDPNAFADYGKAMASAPKNPMAVEWHAAAGAALEQATAPEALAAHVRDAASARALLLKVKGAYDSDPLDLTVIAAVTQYVMGPDARRCPLAFWRANPRTVWTEALLERAAYSADTYVRMFMLDQLRWCATPCQAAAIRKIGCEACEPSVKQFACWTARELACPCRRR